MTPTLIDLKRILEVTQALERKVQSLSSEQTRLLWPDIVDLHITARQAVDREEEEGLHRALSETVFKKK